MQRLTQVESAAEPGRAGFVWDALPRGLALFLGGFTLVNLAGQWRAPGFDANLWWIDLRFLPHWVANTFLLVAGLHLVSYGCFPPTRSWRRYLTFALGGVLAIQSVFEAALFYGLLAHKTIHTPVPIPLSLVLGAGFAVIAVAQLRPRSSAGGFRPRAMAAAVCLSCSVVFPLAQMVCFGKTAYRRTVDVIVVFGARVYTDGRPSDALADRVRTACRLYHEGLTSKLLMSGGPGDGAVHETASMKRMAMDLGVKEQDILTDAAGLNTRATVANSLPIFARLHASRVLAVSHFYHLPRIKMAYQRAGLDVVTVPAKESYLLRQTPFNMAREVVALWVYYFRPLV